MASMARGTSATSTARMPSGTDDVAVEAARGHEGVAEAEARRLGEPAFADRSPVAPRRRARPPRSATTSVARGLSMTDEATAQTMARSAAGSVMRTPPTVAAKMSREPTGAPARLSRTAMIIASRDASSPLEVRRGDGSVDGATSACTSATSGRRPSSVTVTQVPGDRVVARRQEQPARVGQPGDADVGQVEAADLVGGAEAVLDRAHEAQPRVPVALELEDDVDEVLEHAGDRRSSRPWSRGRRAARRCRAPWRPRMRLRRDLAHLRDVAGLALDVGARDGLHGVDDEQVGRACLDVAEHRREVGLGGEVERVGHRRRCARRACAPARPTPRR